MGVTSAKQAVVAQLKEQLESAKGVVLTSYKGLTVAQDTELRRELREAGVSYHVVKNTMLRIAAKEAGIEGIEEHLEGTTAFAFSTEDAVAPAKVICGFIKKNKLEDAEVLTVKVGMVEGKVIGVDGIKPGTPEAAAKAEELSRPLEELGGASLADALLAPTRIYVKPILELLRGGAPVHAIAHITGGGITENLNRALADDVDAVVTRNGAEMGWDVPPVITYVSRQAELAPNEACKTFNMGVGLCLIVAPEDEAAVTEALVALGEKPFRVGECVEGSGKVVYSDER